MLLSGIVFLVSALALAAMVWYRSWEIERGRLSVPDEKMQDFFFSIDDVERGMERFVRKTNVFMLHALILSLSHFVSFLRQVRRSASEEWELFAARLPNHLPEPRSGSSFFLKDISAHKEEVRRVNGYHE